MFFEAAVGDGLPVDGQWGLAAKGGINVDVVKEQVAARQHMIGPTQIIRADRFGTMPAVDENQAQRRGPAPSGNERGTHEWYDDRFETSLRDRAAKSRQRVDGTAARVPEFGVEVFFTRLLFLGAAVMIDGEKNTAALAAGRAEVNGRLPAVAADFKARP
jgi:hypothetical protein